MFSEINGQPLLQHGPYGAALLDFAPTAQHPTSNSHAVVATPPPHHQQQLLPSISQTERLLIQENLLLRQSCQQLMVQVDQLNRNRDYLNTQFTTFHLLYVQQKQDRARLARQLTSTQRELEHLKRAQVLANSVALGHHPVQLESSTLPGRRRPPPHHHNYHHHQLNNNSANGHHNHHNSFFYRSLKVNGSSGKSARSTSRPWRRTQSAKYGGSSTSTIDQDPQASSVVKPRSKVASTKKEANKLSKLSSTYHRYDELNEEDHKTPVVSPSTLTDNAPAFPGGQEQIWVNAADNDHHQRAFNANPENLFINAETQIQVHQELNQFGNANDQQPVYMHPDNTGELQFEHLLPNQESGMQPSQQRQQPLLASSEDEGAQMDASESEDGEEGSPKKSTKLAYRDSLRQCVEFSRSLLDLSRRHVVGAENDDDENAVDDEYCHTPDSDKENTEQTEPAPYWPVDSWPSAC